MYAQYVNNDKLVIGETYFHVSYVDQDMLIPTVSSLVFLGRNLDNDEVNTLYFQDADSYFAGLRITDKEPYPHSMQLESFPEDSPSVFEFEYALECLMLCSLRRKQ
ncbi:hypothetical protein FHW84_002575 [Dyella sp. SG562]|nr:hypothetical protein [Dyella sp. SG562]